jgi:hypothetical protein
MNERNVAANRPFLVTLAVNRTGTVNDLPGRYCSKQDVWVIDIPNGSIPIVSSCRTDSMAPVTKVKGERDEFCASGLLELSTKTRKELERDDVSPHGTSLLPELVTKTEQIRERDDPSPRLLLELATKTANLPERDDR